MCSAQCTPHTAQHTAHSAHPHSSTFSKVQSNLTALQHKETKKCGHLLTFNLERYKKRIVGTTQFQTCLMGKKLASAFLTSIRSPRIRPISNLFHPRASTLFYPRSRHCLVTFFACLMFFPLPTFTSNGRDVPAGRPRPAI